MSPEKKMGVFQESIQNTEISEQIKRVYYLSVTGLNVKNFN